MLGIVVLIILALLALSVIVVVHEFGHFWAAKRSGVWVEEFGVGLPPRIWGRKIGGTIYSINLFPFGGFVRLHGETLNENARYPKRAFNNKSAKARIFIALAGIGMNFVLALVCFTIVYSIRGVITEKKTSQVRVVEVAVNSPAQIVGILPEDIIKTVDTTAIISPDQFIEYVNQKKGERVKIAILRDTEVGAQDLTFTVTPRQDPPEGEGSVGIAITNIELETYYPPLWQRPFVGAYHGVKSTVDFTKLVLGGFAQVGKSVGSGQAPQGLVGFTGILAIFAFVFRQGFTQVLDFIGIVSLNLAIFNLIPFPPLDGSRVMFVLAEKVFGRRILPRVESIAHSTGMIILLILMIVITGQEIPKLLSAGSLSGFIDSLIK